MISSEKEQVPFSNKIVPADAKGMVEKWLMEVQVTMIRSMKDVLARSVEAYPKTKRTTWVTEWPGQVNMLCPIPYSCLIYSIVRNSQFSTYRALLFITN